MIGGRPQKGSDRLEAEIRNTAKAAWAKARKSQRWRELTERIEQLRQEYFDQHMGEPYVYGDDDELDGLHDHRLALPLEDDSVTMWPEAWEVANELREAELEKLKWPEVTRRLTTHERIKRGLGDTYKGT